MEKRALNIVRNLLSERLGIELSVVEKPDEKNRNTKDIDLLLKNGKNQHFAFEHTSIDAYEDQRGIQNNIYNFLKPIFNELKRVIPKDRYFKLIVPHEFIINLSNNKKKELRKKLIDWIKINLKILNEKDGYYCELGNKRNTFRLYCRGAHKKLNGEIMYSIWIPENIDIKQKERVIKSLKSKLPKLKNYQKNATTVLILEDTDISMNSVNAIEGCLKNIKWRFLFSWPNYIIYLLSHNNKFIDCWIFKENKHWYNKIGKRHYQDKLANLE